MNNILRFEKDGAIYPLHNYKGHTVHLMGGLRYALGSLDFCAYELELTLAAVVNCAEDYTVGFFPDSKTYYNSFEVLKLGKTNLFCGVELVGLFVDDIRIKSGTTSAKTNRVFLKNFIDLF